MNENETFPGFSNHLTLVKADDLRIGMYVSKLDRPWLETNFLFQGFELKTAEDIKAVQQQCEFVYVDSARENKAKVGAARNTPYSKGWLESRQPPPRRKSFSQEMENAGHVHQQVSTVIKGFMEAVQLGRAINVEIAKKAVADCVASVLNQPDALMWMTQMKNRDEYTSQHSMNVCIYAIALGRQINLPVNDLHELGLCGMMHDMGKMRVPLEVLNKPGRLTESELRIMQSHTTLGWKLLMSTSGMYGGAIDVAYTHHEKLDGTGYPRGLTAEQISPYARMVAIADMYDAITSDRVYQQGRTHLEAINIMTKLGDSHLDSGLTIKFIECLGIYPPGSVVEMGNGEVAIVVEVNPKAKIKPRIILLLDEEKKPQAERLVDLAHMALDSAGQPYTIRRIVRADEYRIDLTRFYADGGLRRGLAMVTE